MTIQQKLEEFREKFELRMNGCSECGGADLLFRDKNEYDLEVIESFIQTALTEQLDELEKEVEKIKRVGNPEFETNQDFGFNQAISEIKQLINNKK